MPDAGEFVLWVEIESMRSAKWPRGSGNHRLDTDAQGVFLRLAAQNFDAQTRLIIDRMRQANNLRRL